MKMIKIAFLSLLSVLLICIFVGCSSDDISPGNFDTANDNNIETTETTTENTNAYVDESGIIQNSELAKSCQKIIGSGADKNGDIYEIVANVSEDYQGSQLVVGVIKNSQWLIELTEDNPYIVDGLWDVSGKDIDNIRCNYLSNGTFYEDYYPGTSFNSYSGDNFDDGVLNLWNVESNQTLYLENLMLGNGTIYPCTNLNSNDPLVLIKSESHGWTFNNTLMLLNTDDLSIHELYTVRDTEAYYTYSQISDGLFYVPLDFPNSKRIGTFYNENGEKVFDLGEYDTDKTDIVSVGDFENGQCTIYNRLENGSKFKIIIDKQGNMISQEKVEQETQSE